MPAKTAKQRRFMGSDLARALRGKKTKTGMSTEKLRHFATEKGHGHKHGGGASGMGGGAG